MKFIDYVRRNPICFDGETDQFTFDASTRIHGATVFDITEVAEQMIETIVENPGGGIQTTHTTRGKEWVKLRRLGDGYSLDESQYIGIIPPFDNCWFEYSLATFRDNAADCAIHLRSMPKKWIESTFPDGGFAFVTFATVFFNFRLDGLQETGRETTAMICSDDEGRLLVAEAIACVPPGTDRTLARNRPQWTPIIILLISLMMLDYKLVKSTLSPEIVKSRQQRKSEARHPWRAQPALVRYYTLSLDTDRVRAEGGGDSGGTVTWEQAWHVVRAHLRRLKSGKVVVVRAHSKGNPLKGVIHKDYKMVG